MPLFIADLQRLFPPPAPLPMSTSIRQRVLHFWTHRRRSRTAGALLWALAVQAGLLMVTLFVVVLVPRPKEKPAFVAHKTVYLPQKVLDHRIAQAAFEQHASPPMQMQRIQSQSMALHALPELPTLPQSTFNPMVTPDQMAPSAALLGASGMAGLAGDLANETTAVSFFGIRDQGQRIVIAFDVSKSVLNKAQKRGVSVDRIREECKRLIDGMSANTTFSVVQFVRRFECFESQLVAGTQANKQQAAAWVEQEFHTTGLSPRSWQRIESDDGRPVLDGVQAVLEVVFAWEPDVLFLISDGGFGRNHPTRRSEVDLDELDRDLRRLQQALVEPARIHFIGFEMEPDRERGIRRVLSRWKGQFRTF